MVVQGLWFQAVSGHPWGWRGGCSELREVQWVAMMYWTLMISEESRMGINSDNLWKQTGRQLNLGGTHLDISCFVLHSRSMILCKLFNICKFASSPVKWENDTHFKWWLWRLMKIIPVNYITHCLAHTSLFWKLYFFWKYNKLMLGSSLILMKTVSHFSPYFLGPVSINSLCISSSLMYPRKSTMA